MATSKELNDAVRKQFLGIEPKPEVKVKPAVQVSEKELNKRLNRAIGVPLTQAPDPMLAVFERTGNGTPPSNIAKRANGDVKTAVVHATSEMRASVAKLAAEQQTLHTGGRVDASGVVAGISYSTKAAKLLAQCGPQFLYRRVDVPNAVFLVEQDSRLEKSDGTPIKATFYVLEPKEVVNWFKANGRNIVDYGLPPHLKALLPTVRR
jgi:hypothetical protein